MNCKYCKAKCGFSGEWRERDCKGYIPMTNADRIRAMSDEELAEFISNCGCPDHARNCKASCKDCNMEWLKQPADEEAQQDCTYNRNGHCTAQKMMPDCDPKRCDRERH